MLRYKIDGIFFLFVILIFCPRFVSYSKEEKPQITSSVVFQRLLTEANQKNILLKPVAKQIPKLKPRKITSITVTASVYFPVVAQTDETPFITADGSRINKKHPKKHKWIAVSRNLLSRWGGHIDYGDKVNVSGISDHLDGVYVVRDTMKRRLRNRIDILVGPHDKVMGKWSGVKITKL